MKVENNVLEVYNWSLKGPSCQIKNKNKNKKKNVFFLLHFTYNDLRRCDYAGCRIGRRRAAGI